MKIKVLYSSDDDGEKENVEVVNDAGATIASVNTQADCPEDNSVSRLGIVDLIKSIVSELGGEYEYEEVDYE